jgi:hypothetical protein
MKLNATYEIRDGYLYVKVAGEYDPTTARAVTLEWIEKARSHALNRILCDITLMTGFDARQKSVMTQFEISEFVAERFPRDFRLAILGAEQQFTKDLFLENVLSNRGVLAKVTFRLNEALEWLGMPSANKADAGDVQ